MIYPNLSDRSIEMLQTPMRSELEGSKCRVKVKFLKILAIKK